MINFLKRIQSLFYQKIIVNIVVFAIITTGLYAIFIKNLDSNIIREIDDNAFSLMSIYIDIEKEFKEKIYIYKVDNEFLKQESLMDDFNRTNSDYREFIPRRYITDFIDKLDKRTPKLLFIDYTLDSPRISLDKLPFDEDKLKRAIKEEEDFIEILNKKGRTYPIYLVHNENYNYLEKSITSKNIKFVSTIHIKECSALRRYEPYIQRTNHLGVEDLYYYAPFEFLGINNSTIIKENKIVNNRFIYQKIKEVYIPKIKSFSFSVDVKYLPLEKINNSMVFIGESHSDSLDKHNILNIEKKVDGIDIIANNVMSIAYLNSQLKLVPFWTSLFLIFCIALIARILSILVANKIVLFIKNILDVGHKLSLLISVFIFIFFLSFINILVSWILLVYGKVWFSYSISYVILKIITLIK